MDFSKTKFRADKLSQDGFSMDAAPKELHTMEALEAQGIGFNQASDPIAYVMDGLSTVTEPSIGVPYQFLQYWIRKPVKVVTQATVIDDILGRTTGAEWWHESVVLNIRELTGHAAPYGDWANAPRVGRNYNQQARTIVRLAAGLVTGKLESLRSKAMQGMYSEYEDEREAIAQCFKLDRNAIGFYGYRLGPAQCYGLLNDPNLGAFEEVATTSGGSTQWVDKNYMEICRDLNMAVAALQKQAGGNFNPAKDKFKLCVALGCDQYLNTPNEHGHTVRQFVYDNWKNCEIIQVPEFDNAVGDESVFYLIAAKLGDSAVAEQYVPASLFLVGSAQRETGVSELYSMATAGCFVEQPLGIVRFFGI